MSRVFICSGGLDSSIMTKALIEKDDIILAFDYGQKHAKKELDALKKLFPDFNPLVIDIKNLMSIQNSALLEHSQRDVPEGKYDGNNIPVVEVRNRNLYFLLAASSIPGVTEVFYGAHSNDSVVYPDCRPDFVRAANHILQIQDNNVVIKAPFLNFSKGEIVKWGINHDVPLSFMFETYSCYNGKKKHCGKCPTCIDRLKAFQFAGVEDKTEYEN